MRSTFTSSPLSLVESFSGKQDNALGRFDPGRRGLAGGRADGQSMEHNRYSDCAEKVQGASVDIILTKMPTAGVDRCQA
jgi:hypothetical protein